ncbi:HDOD domain-containing protein, partial [Citrobacter sp. AAK_AS5]
KTIQTLLLTSVAHRVIASAREVAAQLWDHSYAAAVACREFAREMGRSVLQREEAFLAGLFHDVGKGVIAARFPGVYRDASG